MYKELKSKSLSDASLNTCKTETTKMRVRHFLSTCSITIRETEICRPVVYPSRSLFYEQCGFDKGTYNMVFDTQLSYNNGNNNSSMPALNS